MAIVNNPQADIVQVYKQAAATIDAPMKFNPLQFSKVMEELRGKFKTV
jgi:hypothetical protein